MKTGSVGIGLAVFCILAISFQVPMTLGANVRSFRTISAVSCTGLPSGFTGQGVFYAKTHVKNVINTNSPTFECNDNGINTLERTITCNCNEKLLEWSVAVSLMDASGVIVAENFDSGGKAKGSLTATVTATFDTMSVTGSIEWFPP